MCLFYFSACFEQPSAHHQEDQLYQYIIWYISLCVCVCVCVWHSGMHVRVILLLYMFPATQCSSSGESIVSIHHLVYITVCVWHSSMHVRVILLLCMLRATQCSSSGESIVSIHHLVYITLCVLPSGMHVRVACFEQPSAHHQENQLYQYIIWYISLCVCVCVCVWHSVMHVRVILLLCMFRATQCSSSGESIVSIHHPVYITLCGNTHRVIYTG